MKTTKTFRSTHLLLGLFIVCFLLTSCNPTKISLMGSSIGDPAAYAAEYLMNVFVGCVMSMFFLFFGIGFFIVTAKPERNKSGIKILRIMTIGLGVLCAFPAYVSAWAVMFGISDFSHIGASGDEMQVMDTLLRVFGFLGFATFLAALGLTLAGMKRANREITVEDDLI